MIFAFRFSLLCVMCLALSCTKSKNNDSDGSDNEVVDDGSKEDNEEDNDEGKKATAPKLSLAIVAAAEGKHKIIVTTVGGFTEVIIDLSCTDRELPIFNSEQGLDKDGKTISPSFSYPPAAEEDITCTASAQATLGTKKYEDSTEHKIAKLKNMPAQVTINGRISWGTGESKKTGQVKLFGGGCTAALIWICRSKSIFSQVSGHGGSNESWDMDKPEDEDCHLYFAGSKDNCTVKIGDDKIPIHKDYTPSMVRAEDDGQLNNRIFRIVGDHTAEKVFYRNGTPVVALCQPLANDPTLYKTTEFSGGVGFWIIILSGGKASLTYGGIETGDGMW